MNPTIPQIAAILRGGHTGTLRTHDGLGGAHVRLLPNGLVATYYCTDPGLAISVRERIGSVGMRFTKLDTGRFAQTIETSPVAQGDYSLEEALTLIAEGYPQPQALA